MQSFISLSKTIEVQIEKYRHLIAGIFFICFFIIGILISKDFGVHWDEYRNQDFGNRWTTYISGVIKSRSFTKPYPHKPPRHLLQDHDFIHGPFLETSLTLLKIKLRLTDSREIILLRHLTIFIIFFIGTIVFYFLCLHHFRNWKLALLGTLFLILTPRLFSHAFYNTVDIGFLVFFTSAIFTLINFLKKKTYGSLTLHAAISALACDIRIIGTLLIPFTIASILAAPAKNKNKSIIDSKFLLFFLFLFTILFILFCPYLWISPYSQFLLVLKAILGVRHNPSVFYLGESFPIESLPWHYVPVWILASTPLIYIILFMMGCISLAKLFINKTPKPSIHRIEIILFIFWLFIPLLLSKGRAYDTWRHFFFIYPAFIIIAIKGVQYILEGFKKEFCGRTLAFFHFSLTVILSINLISVVVFMIKNHPFEDFYFNSLAGKNMQEIKKNFELNYWGTPYKQALEYILKHDPSRLIRIQFSKEEPGNNNLKILPIADRQRFLSVDKKSKPKYFIAQIKNPEDWPYKNEYYSILINGTKILTVFRLNYHRG